MIEPAKKSIIEEENSEQLARLLFALHERDKATFVIISFDSYEIKERIYHKLQNELSEYLFYDLDLTAQNVVSLNRALKETLPGKILNSKNIGYIVHVFGLENSLFRTINGQLEDSPLIPELNFERELLFRDMPFITILWTSCSIIDKLKTDARDLWDWVNYSFTFKSEPPDEEVNLDELNKEADIPKGHQPERHKRIDTLIKKYNKLKLDSSSKERIEREKLSIQLMLGREYVELHEYDNAVKSFKTALGISSHLNDNFVDIEIRFRLGDAYLGSRNFDDALTYYSSSLNLQTELNYEQNIGSTYHQIGMVYQEQRKWGDALQQYQNAVKWKKKNKNYYDIGSTYHQIGHVYQMQRKWNDALQQYQFAVKWDEKNKNYYQIGTTYHQIGMVYAEQKKWDHALQQCQNAIKWYEKTKNFYKIGGTYHQIGRVYEEQEKWDNAVMNYFTAYKYYLVYENSNGREIILDSIKRTLLDLSHEKCLKIFEKTFSDQPENIKDRAYQDIFA